MRQLMAAALISFFSINAYAVPVQWVFENVTFRTQQDFCTSCSPTPVYTIEGSFTYDADTDVFSNVNVTASGGPDAYFPSLVVPLADYEGATYDDHLRFQSNGVILTKSSDGATSLSDPLTSFLSINWSASGPGLTNAGGTISIFGQEAVDSLGANRSIQTGTLSAVPVPAAVWLFGSALAGLGWMRRKQTA